MMYTLNIFTVPYLFYSLPLLYKSALAPFLLHENPSYDHRDCLYAPVSYKKNMRVRLCSTGINYYVHRVSAACVLHS